MLSTTTKNMLTTVFLKGNGNFWKVASFGVTYRLLTILVTWRFQDHTWYHQNDEFWASEGCKIIGKGISIDKTAIYMYICVVYHSKSLQRVYCGIFWQHFLVKIQKMWNKRFFSINFCCNTLQIMFIEYLEQKTMRTNIKNIFFPVFPRIMGKTVKKTTPSTVGPYKHNQDQPIKNINNKIFCSSLWVLSVGKAFFLPRLPSKNSPWQKWQEKENDAKRRHPWNHRLRTIENSECGCFFL